MGIPRCVWKIQKVLKPVSSWEPKRPSTGRIAILPQAEAAPPALRSRVQVVNSLAQLRVNPGHGVSYCEGRSALVTPGKAGIRKAEEEYFIHLVGKISYGSEGQLVKTQKYASAGTMRKGRQLPGSLARHKFRKSGTALRKLSAKKKSLKLYQSK